MKLYEINNLSSQIKKVEPIERIRFNSQKEFDIFLNEKQKNSFFKESTQVRVVPNNKNNGSQIILEKLSESNEIFIFAECINEKIYISVKMKNGKIYKNLCCYDNFLIFQEDFKKF